MRDSKREVTKKPAFKKEEARKERFKKDFKKTDNKKSDYKKTEYKKPEYKKTEYKKTEYKKPEFKKTEYKKDIEKAPYEQDDVQDDNKALQLEGRNAVLEALNSGKTIDRILVKKGENEGTIRVIIAKARERGIVISETVRQKLDETSESGNHQGVIALCPAYEYVEVEEILEAARAKNEEPFIIVLDGIADPHNLGAIIRTADAVGAHGVIIPKRRACGMTATVVKASAGAIEYVPVARVTNIVQTIEMLKKNNIWTACADMDGQLLYDAPLTGAMALVVGGEGDGVSRLVKEKCDFSVKIPMGGSIASLNASVAAAVVMYEVVRRRR